MTEHYLLRSGPDEEQCPKLDPLSKDDFQSAENDQLREIYYCFFGSSLTQVLFQNKIVMLRSAKDQKHLLDHLHPYFTPHKPYLHRLFLLVQAAHRYHLDDIHTSFSWVLGEAKETLWKLQFPFTPASENEFALHHLTLNAFQTFKDDYYNIDEKLDL